MSLTLDQVEHVAKLARIALSGTEAQTIQGHLNGVFGLIKEMQAIDTQGVEPMPHPQDINQRLREDIVTETDRRDAYQAIAPDVEAGLYLVPKVIE